MEPASLVCCKLCDNEACVLCEQCYLNLYCCEDCRDEDWEDHQEECLNLVEIGVSLGSLNPSKLVKQVKKSTVDKFNKGKAPTKEPNAVELRRLAAEEMGKKNCLLDVYSPGLWVLNNTDKDSFLRTIRQLPAVSENSAQPYAEIMIDYTKTKATPCSASAVSKNEVWLLQSRAEKTARRRLDWIVPDSLKTDTSKRQIKRVQCNLWNIKVQDSTQMKELLKMKLGWSQEKIAELGLQNGVRFVVNSGFAFDDRLLLQEMDGYLNLRMRFLPFPESQFDVLCKGFIKKGTDEESLSWFSNAENLVWLLSGNQVLHRDSDQSEGPSSRKQGIVLLHGKTIIIEDRESQNRQHFVEIKQVDFIY